MRICLVRIPSPFLIDERMFPPLGLMAVGTGLKVLGHDVHIHDGTLDAIPLDYEYYGFGPAAPEYPDAKASMLRIKQHNPEAKVVLGGPHATVTTEACLRDGWDSIVVGDGDVIAEWAFRGFDRVYHGAELPLDSYPITDRTLVDIKSYHYTAEGNPGTTMVTGRGCPQSCAYCCKNYNKVRLMNADRVIREIQYLHHEFGYKVLVFSEDNFLIHKQRSLSVCKELERLGIRWRCLVRADMVVQRGADYLAMVKDSGCAEVGIGIESGSDQILQTVCKGEDAATIKQGIHMLKAAGIKVKGYLIVGLPGETKETLKATFDLLDEVDLDDIDAKMYQPYPGTPIWDHRGMYDIDWDEGDQSKTFFKGKPGEYYGSIRTSALTTEELVEAWKTMETRYKKCASAS